jgi:phosphohistidine phosphatase
MKLLLVRHAKGEDSQDFDGPDAERPLTANSRQRFRAAARGLRKIAPDITLLASSPLKRARQTAEVLARVFAVRAIDENELLAPGASRKALTEWLRGQGDQAVIGLVGHEPDLGELAGDLLTRTRRSFLPIRKAGACLIEFDAAPVSGEGRLLWLLTPAQLRKLGG